MNMLILLGHTEPDLRTTKNQLLVSMMPAHAGNQTRLNLICCAHVTAQYFFKKERNSPLFVF